MAGRLTAETVCVMTIPRLALYKFERKRSSVFAVGSRRQRVA